MYDAILELSDFDSCDQNIGSLLSDRTVIHLLDFLVARNLDILAHYSIPPLYVLAAAGGVRYFRPPPSAEEPDYWRDIRRVMLIGYGDCKDLASWRVAELLHAGEPAATGLIKGCSPDGKKSLYHVVVRRASGAIEDPSKRLGMKGDF